MTTKVEQEAMRVGAEVAAPFAESVDSEGRFPAETVAAFRESRLLSAMVPVECGGAGASLPEISNAVKSLAFHCASSALVFAMHQIEIAYLARHGTTPALRAVLQEVADYQLLFANANSEVGIGGDAGQSICAIERSDGIFRLEKQAVAISYGAYADGVIATARASAESAPTDQVLVLCRPPDLQLEPTSEWNTIGLRGTCSGGFRLVASGDEGYVFPEPFSEIATRTGSPVTQVLLASVWLGLAEAAAAKAHEYARAQARRSVGTPHLSSLRLAELVALLQPLRDMVSGAALHYEAVKDTPEVEEWGFSVRLRNLKIGASTLAVETATKALGICGMAGYSKGSPYSLDRVLRDIHGGPVMVNNDRFYEMNSQVLLIMKET